jgi:hypothetical protein
MRGSRNAICVSRCRLSMPAILRRRIGDAFLFASGVVIVVSVLLAADHRVRERASMLLGDRPLMGLADVAGRAGDLGLIMSHVALRFGVEHSLLTVFAVAATVLFTAVSWL